MMGNGTLRADFVQRGAGSNRRMRARAGTAPEVVGAAAGVGGEAESPGVWGNSHSGRKPEFTVGISQFANCVLQGPAEEGISEGQFRFFGDLRSEFPFAG